MTRRILGLPLRYLRPVRTLIARTVAEHDDEHGQGVAAHDAKWFAGAFPFLVILLYAVAILFDGTGG